jgi:MoaA/NifB/PqqE/SkfB family radical SAM enzyme
VVAVFGAKKENGLRIMSKKSCTFCMHPFTGLATREDGAIQACCRSHPVGFVQKQSLEEIWNGDTMKRIRRQVLNDERPPECEPCFALEDQGVESLRQRHIVGKIPEARINLYPTALDNLKEDYSMPFEIPTMELKLNNLCNLKCRMCHPMDSTSWNDWTEVEEFYKKDKNIIANLVDTHNLKQKPYLDKFEGNPNWWSSFKKLLPYFRRVEFAGGEPLMDPQHYRILDMLQPYANNIEIKYATNLTTLGIKGGRTVHDYWPGFKSVAVNVSMDGIEDSYEYIRGNAKWQSVIDNISEIKKFTNISRIVGACTVQVSNIMVLDRIAEKFLNELEIVFHTHRVSFPKELCIQVLPKELKKLAVGRMEEIKSRIGGFKLVMQHPKLYDYTMGQLNDNINFINAKDCSPLWKDCIEFNNRLDKTRNQSFLETTPEFKDYV